MADTKDVDRGERSAPPSGSILCNYIGHHNFAYEHGGVVRICIRCGFSQELCDGFWMFPQFVSLKRIETIKEERARLSEYLLRVNKRMKQI